MAVVNPGTAEIDLDLTAFAPDGTVIDQKQVAVAAKAKTVGMVRNLFNLSGQGQGSIVVTSDDPFCCFEMFGVIAASLALIVKPVPVTLFV